MKEALSFLNYKGIISWSSRWKLIIIYVEISIFYMWMNLQKSNKRWCNESHFSENLLAPSPRSKTELLGISDHLCSTVNKLAAGILFFHRRKRCCRRRFFFSLLKLIRRFSTENSDMSVTRDSAVILSFARIFLRNLSDRFYCRSADRK